MRSKEIENIDAAMKINNDWADYCEKMNIRWCRITIIALIAGIFLGILLGVSL
jgi:hypothetical protein